MNRNTEGYRAKSVDSVKRDPVKMMVTVIICLVLLIVLIYLVFQFIVLPNIRIDEVTVTYAGEPGVILSGATEDPGRDGSISVAAERIAGNLVGISFSEAEPRALSRAFELLVEIEHAEVHRRLPGALYIELTPRTPRFLLFGSAEATVQTMHGSQGVSSGHHIPVDSQGIPFEASTTFIDHYKGRVPVLTVSDQVLGDLQRLRSSIPHLVEAAEVVWGLKEESSELFNLITQVKYDMNDRKAVSLLQVSFSHLPVEFTVTLGVEPRDLVAYIAAVGEMILTGERTIASVLIHTDGTAICRL